MTRPVEVTVRLPAGGGAIACAVLTACLVLFAGPVSAAPPGAGATVERLDHTDIGDPSPACVGVAVDGRTVVVAAEGGSRLVTVSVADDAGFVFGEAVGAFRQKVLSVTVPLGSPEGAEVGPAAVLLRVERVTDRERWELRGQHRVQSFTRQELVVAGTVGLPGGARVPLRCVAVRTVVLEVSTSPSGPPPGGPAPANDLRAGAVVLAPGEGAVLRTRGARLAPEIRFGCNILAPGDPAALPGRTVWFRFTGTGGTVTVDTAGSRFDTTFAVYRVLAGRPTLVTCADDGEPPVRSLQAQAAVDTARGAQYWVQVGGVGGEHGLLKVALR